MRGWEGLKNGEIWCINIEQIYLLYGISLMDANSWPHGRFVSNKYIILKYTHTKYPLTNIYFFFNSFSPPIAIYPSLFTNTDDVHFGLPWSEERFEVKELIDQHIWDSKTVIND
jgi:hypothetical protein